MTAAVEHGVKRSKSCPIRTLGWPSFMMREAAAPTVPAHARRLVAHSPSLPPGGGRTPSPPTTADQGAGAGGASMAETPHQVIRRRVAVGGRDRAARMAPAWK